MQNSTRWVCKTCSFESNKRTGLLKHYRLKHVNGGRCNSVPCLYTDCPCSFKTFNVFITLLFQIKEEFKRITTIYLERTFLTKLDFYTPKRQEIFGTKGGVAGTKIRPLLDSLSQLHVEDRRDAIIRCLMEFLGESTEELIKDYQDVSKEFVREDYAEHVMKIAVLHGSAAHEGPADVSIIIEGSEVLDDCRCVSKACLLLTGFIYAMNLSYPPKRKYTFEVFQKLFLELNVLKMSQSPCIVQQTCSLSVYKGVSSTCSSEEILGSYGV